MTKAKLSSRFWIALVIFGLTGQIAWVVENMYFNVFIYKMFQATAEQISAMVMASAVAATLTTIFIGALSDKIGKRKLFICGGYILWGISIASFALIRIDVISSLFPMAASAASIGVSLVIIMDCVMTFFGSSANDACFNAWLTDETKDSGRGAAEGINAMMPLVAILAVFGGFMAFDLDKSESWVTIFLIIGIVVIVIGVLGLFLIKESVRKLPENSSFFKNIFYGFKPSVIKSNGMLYITFLGFAVFGISIQIFMPYLILYYTESLDLADTYVFIMAPAVILAAVFTVFYGRLYDKLKFTKSVFPTLGLLVLGYLLLAINEKTPVVFIGSLLMMCGYLAGMAVFGSVIRTHIPDNKAGMFQGLRIVSQVLIPGLIGPEIAKWILRDAEKITNTDGTESFIPNQSIFVAALCVIVVLAAVLLVAVLIAKKREKRGQTNE